MSFKAKTLGVVLGLSAAWLAAPAWAADMEVPLVIKNHQFDPAEIAVPANQRIRLAVHNQDSTPEEFESKKLKREKVIPGGAKAVILVGPLKPGRYEFVGEFHEDSARGVLVVQ